MEQDVRELEPGEEPLAAAAMLALRPRFGDERAIAERMRLQREQGYRIVAAFEPGERHAAAAAGFRIGDNLAWGRFLYVDDLSTRPERRGRGHAGALLSWLAAEARREACDELHLDSGTGPERQDAHRLYLNHRLRITSHHFAREL